MKRDRDSSESDVSSKIVGSPGDSSIVMRDAPPVIGHTQIFYLGKTLGKEEKTFRVFDWFDRSSMSSFLRDISVRERLAG
jgi:hypothetical protein